MSQHCFLDHERIIPISRFSTEAFKTGSWSRSRPQHEEKSSPCNSTCPTANNIPAALYRISERDHDGALAAFLEESPLPSVCGRVCSHACQGRCNRSDNDQAVAIRALERAASDLGSAKPAQLTDAGCGLQVAVIGSGPAGLAGAYHLARMGHPVTLIEQRGQLGGLLAGGIPEYRLPQEALERDLKRILSLGIEVVTGEAVDDSALEELLLSHRAVLVATGSWGAKRLGIPGEELRGVLRGLDFLLDDSRQGEVRGGRVLVIGGGNTAIDAARVALRRGAAAVSILYRPDLEFLPESDDEVREAAEEGIHRFPGYPVEFLGADGKLCALRFREVVSREGNLSIYAESTTEIPFDLAITAIGQTLNDSPLNRALPVEGERIAGDRWGRSGRKGVYIAGDAATARGTVVEAMASGKAAALAIHLDLTGGGNHAELLEGGGFSITGFFAPEKRRPSGAVAQVSAYSYLTAAEIPSQGQPSLHPASRVTHFEEVVGGLGGEEAQSEASRCFFCGTCIGCDLCATYCPDLSMGRVEGKTAYACNPDYCKGCGACAAVCVRGVVTMGEEQ